MAPLGIGLMLFVVELYTVPLTGGAINTARAFGPDVVSGDFPSYHWIYWLGPTLGALVATAFYYILKTIGYWRISPGQDTVDVRESALNDLHTSRSNDSRRATSSLSFSRVGSPQAAAGAGAGLFGGRGRTRGNSAVQWGGRRMLRIRLETKAVIRARPRCRMGRSSDDPSCLLCR